MDSFLFDIAIFFGLIFFACFSWRKIEFGVYAVIFCLPLYLIRQNIFGIPTTALELGIYTLFTVWFIRNYRRLRAQEFIPDKIFLSGVFLLLAGIAAATFLSVDLRVSAGIFKGWFFDPLLFFIVLVSIIKSSGQAENALKAFSASGFAAAVSGLFYWFGLLPDGVSYDGRLHAFFSSPNYLAMYLAVPFIVAVWFFLTDSFPDENRKNSGKQKYFWLVSGFVMAGAIYLTYSYAAWLAVFVAVFLLICLLAPIAKKKVIFTAFLLFFIVLFFAQSGTDKFQSLKDLSYRSSANSRVMIWSSALMIGRDHPVFGIGPGNFQKYYLDYQKRFTEPYLEWAVPEPHNVFLAFWLETGILGLAGFVLILIWFFRSGFLILKKCRLSGIRSIAAVLISSMVYILLHGIFDTTYWKNDLAMIFWLMLGLIFVIKKNSG